MPYYSPSRLEDSPSRANENLDELSSLGFFIASAVPILVKLCLPAPFQTGSGKPTRLEYIKIRNSNIEMLNKS
jgi:hypothetical protein